MKEIPILFSAPMVRALLAGTKTQTRRAVKGQALEWLRPGMFGPEYVALPENGLCPYGQPGDRLWVREAWRAPLAFELTPPRDIPAGTPLRYIADGLGWLPPENAGKYRPPMFMPRWASRITLEVTGVRVERLQDISDADAKAEGCQHNGACDHARRSCEEIGCMGANSYRGGYADLWEQLNGPGSWDANPWVWVVEFKVLP